MKNHNLTTDEFYKRCQTIDKDELLLAFRKALLIVAKEDVKKAEKALKNKV